MISFPQSVEIEEEGTHTPIGIDLTIVDTGREGIRAVVVEGECFGERIVWFEEREVTLIVKTDLKTGLPMLLENFDGSDIWFEHKGYEMEGRTWWRYAHEIDPREYREHCLRIVRKA